MASNHKESDDLAIVIIFLLGILTGWGIWA